jgi:hypothetical protein
MWRKVVLGNNLAGRPNQSFDDLECAVRYRDRDPMCSQFTPREIDLPRSKLVYRSSALLGVQFRDLMVHEHAMRPKTGARHRLSASVPELSRAKRDFRSF